MLTYVHTQFIFDCEMDDLIFCELDITSSPSPTKRMYVLVLRSGKISFVTVLEQNTLNSRRCLLWWNCNITYLGLKNRLRVVSRYCFFCVCLVFLHLLWSHASCCFPNCNGGNDSTGDQPYGHRLKYFGKELWLTTVIL